MAISKKSEFTDTDNELATFAKALSHPARILILKTLAKKNICVCGEIVDVLPLSQSTVSQHLQELKKAGIIKGEIDGVRSCYCIDWKKLNKNIKSLFKLLKNLKNDCTCEGSTEKQKQT
jgi:DNA-binding transcriptional ArsR family regulator